MRRIKVGMNDILILERLLELKNRNEFYKRFCINNSLWDKVPYYCKESNFYSVALNEMLSDIGQKESNYTFSIDEDNLEIILYEE